MLRTCGTVDFDDLLLLPVQLFDENQEARRALWRRWHYVMSNEYQDTNGVHLDMARHLAGGRRNLCVVGDDDQSIYAFQGAAAWPGSCERVHGGARRGCRDPATDKRTSHER